jgi:parallel beta-helix repeat protein
MEIEAAEDANLTAITLGGFEPSTTYYKYEGDYHNEVTFTTDAGGSYSYAQDLAEPHLVFIQPRPSTRFIPGDPDIGTWDPDTRTYTLKTNVYETIQIDEDNLTLDGAADLGYTVSGSGSGFGIYLNGRTGVTIQDVNVQGFSYGIYLRTSTGDTVIANGISNNPTGIYLWRSSTNTVTGNTVSNSGRGIRLAYSDDNMLTHNDASSNLHGFHLFYSAYNELTSNTANSNEIHGIYLFYSANNALTRNTIATNGEGVRFDWSSNNKTYNNNFIQNVWAQAHDSHGVGNIFNLDRPTGGNYWSNWTSPDNDGDGFVDLAFLFYDGGEDSLPWTIPNGWLRQPPAAVCQDVTVMVDSNCEGVVEPEDVDNGSWDPDGDPITLSLSPEGPYPMGTTGVTLTVTDDQGASSVCTATVKVLGAGEGILQLIAKVMVLNLHNGIENSLDAKLDAALKALDDLNANNDVAAINAIEAFINAVEAQRGDKIAAEDADDLIDTANKIIVALQNGCY